MTQAQATQFTNTFIALTIIIEKKKEKKKKKKKKKKKGKCRGCSGKYLQVKGADLEYMGIRGRKRGKEVRGDKKRQPFTCRKEKRRCFYWARAAAQLQHP
jgi:hypothetical protein